MCDNKDKTNTDVSYHAVVCAAPPSEESRFIADTFIYHPVRKHVLVEDTKDKGPEGGIVSWFALCPHFYSRISIPPLNKFCPGCTPECRNVPLITVLIVATVSAPLSNPSVNLSRSCASQPSIASSAAETRSLELQAMEICTSTKPASDDVRSSPFSKARISARLS